MKKRFKYAFYNLVQRMSVAELFADEESNKDMYEFINKKYQTNESVL